MADGDDRKSDDGGAAEGVEAVAEAEVSFMDLQKAPRVSETVLKRSRRSHASAVEFADALSQRTTKRQLKRVGVIKRAEGLVKAHRQRENSLGRVRRRLTAAKRDNAPKVYVPKDAQSVLIVQVQSLSPRVDAASKRLVRSFGLRGRHTGVVRRIDAQLLQSLRLVEKYVTWGYPNVKTIKELIYKRAHVLVNDKLVPLSDNALVEEELGDCGVICLEDIIYELSTVGPNFDRVNEFIGVFTLEKRHKGEGDVAQPEQRSVTEGNKSGNRGPLINEYIASIN